MTEATPESHVVRWFVDPTTANGPSTKQQAADSSDILSHQSSSCVISGSKTSNHEESNRETMPSESPSRQQIDELIAIADGKDDQNGTGDDNFHGILFHESTSDTDESQSYPPDRSVTPSHSEGQPNALNIDMDIDLAGEGVVLRGVLPPTPNESLKRSPRSHENSIDRGSTQETSQLSCSERLLESWDNPTLSEPDLSRLMDYHHHLHHHLQSSESPPSEVVAIRENNVVLEGPRSDETMALRMEDMELLVATYRTKLDKADDLIESLFRDLEKSRRSMHLLSTRNATLISEKKAMRSKMIDRSFLLKTCLYICPVFVLCGSFEAFISTVVMVWVFVELQLVDVKQLDEEDDDGNDDSDIGEVATDMRVPRKANKRRRRKETRISAPIPTHIELPSTSIDDQIQGKTKASF